eukprot:scaffold27457_cov29-Tisochrysis_lutea.AAC.2
MGRRCKEWAWHDGVVRFAGEIHGRVAGWLSVRAGRAHLAEAAGEHSARTMARPEWPPRTRTRCSRRSFSAAVLAGLRHAIPNA